MRTFAQRQNQPNRSAPSTLVRSVTATTWSNHQTNLTLPLRRTIENEGTRRRWQTHTEEPDGELTAAASPGFARDFSRIPIHASAAKAIQTKLEVGSANDPLEHEADRFADQIVATSPQSGISGAPPTIHRFSEQANAQTNVAPASVDRALSDPGKPLEEPIRREMEMRFGYDFSRVRVHSGATSEQSARELEASAYTVGPNIVFARGQYAPHSVEGRKLIAHELTHVIQQGGGVTPGRPNVASQRLSIQRQTGTDYGLAVAGSRNKYVAEAVRLWTTQKSMKVWDFADTLMKVIEKDLRSQGVPELKWKKKPGLGTSGSFDQEKWLVEIDPDAFSSNGKAEKLADLSLDEVKEVVGTLYHESRHTDQDVMIIRSMLDQKKTVKEIVKAAKYPKRIVEAVKATKFQTAPTKEQVEHANRMFAVMYGEHKELLGFMMKNIKIINAVQGLTNAKNASDIKNAAPQVKQLGDWTKTVLEPKVKKLQQGGTSLGAQAAQLRQDLGELNDATSKFLEAYAAASKIKKPTQADLTDVQEKAEDWFKKLSTAYKNLEGEKDAFAVEEQVKTEFEKKAAAPP